MFSESDIWRFVMLLICSVNLILLLISYRRHNAYDNAKTRDYWFSQVAWSVAGIEFSIEGIVRSSPFGFRIIFVLVAALVAFKGLVSKGSWGDKG